MAHARCSMVLGRTLPATAAHPVMTPRRPLDRVRELRAADPARTTPLVVELADGRHELAEPLLVENVRSMPVMPGRRPPCRDR